MTTPLIIHTLFFDLGATLVDPKFTGNQVFDGFTVLPGVPETLQALTAANLKLGIISNTGDIAPQAVRTALRAVQLLDYFAENLILLSGEIHLDKTTPAIFRLATSRANASATPRACMYVGDDSDERRNARLAGLKTVSSIHAIPAGIRTNTAHGMSPNLSNMAACIHDAAAAAAENVAGPGETDNYRVLIGALGHAKLHLPPAYQQRVATPFIAELERIGETGFKQIMLQDPAREGAAGLMFDIAQAIMQNGNNFDPVPTKAFQEVVSDLYDGFLGAQSRAGVKLADNVVLAPLVKWGNPESGPYTWPIDDTSAFHIGAGIVSLPPSNSIKGLFAWPALAHETAGHDILHADNGLLQELSDKVRSALNAVHIGAGLADYWAKRIDETASDVMGILNMGPAAGIGLIVYFRGLNQAFGGVATLRNRGPEQDPHPGDILRGFLAAAVVRLLKFDGAIDWANSIEKETAKDVTQITVADVPVSVAKAKQACEIVAKVLCATRMQALENRALLDIQNWRNQDEMIVAKLRKSLVDNTGVDASQASGIFAAHVVAAAAYSALAGDISVALLFERMIGVLRKMHDVNPSWGPLLVRHPGNIRRDFLYLFAY